MVSFSSMMPLAVVLLLSALVSVSAHGWLSSPSSRQDQCKVGTVKNCGNIQYEPQSVEALKGKLTCNGDVPNWAVLADDSMPWNVIPVAKGVQKFSWTQTAIHPAANWVYYIQNGNTMQKIGEFLGTANTQHCLDLSAWSGKQKLLAVWNIADTVNAFYSCVDVNIGATAVVPNCVGGGANTFTPVTSDVSKPGCTSTTTQTSYIVGAGDTLASVAAARGLTVAQLLAVNPLKTAASRIEVGTSLIIPPTTTQYCAPIGSTVPSSTAGSRASSTGTSSGGGSTSGGTGTCLTSTPTTYTLKAGESLMTIAARVGLTIDDLMRVNSGLFTTGQTLALPYNTCSTGGRTSGRGNNTDDGSDFDEASSGMGGLEGNGAHGRATSSLLLVASAVVAAAAALLSL